MEDVLPGCCHSNPASAALLLLHGPLGHPPELFSVDRGPGRKSRDKRRVRPAGAQPVPTKGQTKRLTALLSRQMFPSVC